MISCPEIWTEFFEKYYSEEINNLAFRIKSGGDKRAIYVNFIRDLSVFQEGRLGEELIENPDEVLTHAEKGLASSTNIYGVSLEGCKPRFHSLPSTKKIMIRDIRSSHISKFIAIEGIIRKVTEVRPRIISAAFKCLNCRNVIQVPQDDSTLRYPYECRCGSKRFHLIPEKSISIDSQRVKIQEYPENLRGGEQPQSIDVILEGDLTGVINPGDRVIINGIVRAKPRGVQQRMLTHMDLFIEGNSIEMLQQEYEEFEITEKDKEEIMKLARSDDIYEKVVRTIAPSIYGHEDIKLAIALQLFGGVAKKLPDGTEIRGDIHILLVGDPGVAKSQLLKYVHRIAPRSVYTTGKGTTSAGLTATAVRDEIDGRWTLEAGALVLADKGIALVDEIDKMRKEDRSALHEALEQQTISVAKAGINAILKARCALLAAANPKLGRFDRYSPIAEQIELSPTLLSRFDLIFVMTDEPGEERDKQLASHILNMHQLGEMLEKFKGTNIKEDLKSKISKIEPAVDPELFRKYIAFSRNIFPVLSEEAKQKIEEFYVSLRSRVKENSPVPITARQLESIVRLAEASARIRLSDTVSAEDVERVIGVVQRCLAQIAVDPETGDWDIDYAYTGTSKKQRDRIFTIKKIIEELEDLNENGAPEEEIVSKAREKGIEESKAREILSKLKMMGEAFCPKYGFYRIVRRR
ncbi:MAG: minichromosome maintenance protein MCM [Archaeoglobaceae archaeon]|nr:minichromosome maintenance protein MCM [Archaeoglobaceae archaeon]MDW8127726.1 minichromosome maintenance protein MCM [Archaeoglobaceae archaeon]